MNNNNNNNNHQLDQPLITRITSPRPPIQKTALFCTFSLFTFSSIFSRGSADPISPYVWTPMRSSVWSAERTINNSRAGGYITSLAQSTWWRSVSACAVCRLRGWTKAPRRYPRRPCAPTATAHRRATSCWASRKKTAPLTIWLHGHNSTISTSCHLWSRRHAEGECYAAKHSVTNVGGRGHFARCCLNRQTPNPPTIGGRAHRRQGRLGGRGKRQGIKRLCVRTD